METFSQTHIIITENPFVYPMQVGEFVELVPAKSLKERLSAYGYYKTKEGKVYRIKKTAVAAVTFYDGPRPMEVI